LVGGEFGDRTIRNDFAVPQNSHAVTDLVNLFEFMGDKDKGHACLPNGLDDLKEISNFATCKSRRRFVHDDHRGAMT
jgi:hypothetical protein